MGKEIQRAIVIFLLLFSVFTAAVIISEAINNKHILETYPDRLHTAIPDVVTISKPSQEAFDFQKSKVTTWLIRMFMSFVIPAFFIFSRLSAKIRDWACGRAKRWAFVIILYFITYSLIEAIIYFPLDYFTGYLRMHQYGLSNQTFYQWLSQFLKSFVVNTLIASVLIWVPFWIIKKSPKRWWLYLGMVIIPYLFVMSYLQPVVIDPIFNHYKPVEDTQLAAKIDDLLSKTSINKCEILQVDKSKETNQLNAYMTGVFNTKRIVLWDTTINYLNTEETLGIVAHEMGHYLMGHIWKSIILGGMGAIVALFFVYRMSCWFLRKSNGKWGFTKLSDVAAYPLIILMINVVLFASSPIYNAYSRNIETEADRFEIELTKNNFATGTATVKLHQQSLTMPEPGLVYMLWNYDHPTFKFRVDFANEYRPWEKGEPLKYQKYIKNK